MEGLGVLASPSEVEEVQKAAVRLDSLVACLVRCSALHNQHSSAEGELEVLLLEVAPGEENGCSFVAVVLVAAGVEEMVAAEACHSEAFHMVEQMACAKVPEKECNLGILHTLVEAEVLVPFPCRSVVQQDSRWLLSCSQVSCSAVHLVLRWA